MSIQLLLKKKFIVILHDAEVAEKGPTIKVNPVEQGSQGQLSTGGTQAARYELAWPLTMEAPFIDVSPLTFILPPKLLEPESVIEVPLT